MNIATKIMIWGLTFYKAHFKVPKYNRKKDGLEVEFIRTPFDFHLYH